VPGVFVVRTVVVTRTLMVRARRSLRVLMYVSIVSLSDHLGCVFRVHDSRINLPAGWKVKPEIG
jgi:hypothetical protein